MAHDKEEEYIVKHGRSTLDSCSKYVGVSFGFLKKVGESN